MITKDKKLIIKPCPNCKYYEVDKDGQMWCNNVALWGYRKDLDKVVMYCPKYQEKK